MARARLIKPSVTKNSKLGKLPIHVRYLFVCLPMHADCEGKMEDDVERLHVEIFPYEPKLNVDKMLNDLVLNDFITRYEVGGEKFIWINKFLKHQSPHKKEREKGSDIPDYDPNSHNPGNSGAGIVPAQYQHTTSPALTLNPYTLTLDPPSGKSLVDEKVDEITEFYKTKINSVEIQSGRRNLANLAKKSNIDKLFQATKNYHQHLLDTKKTGTEYVIRMRNFFGRDKRWEDYQSVPAKVEVQNGKKPLPERN